MKILFSPLGLTDPISNYRDGAMLNICRNYEIDKVYLYMSAEVYGYHKHDNRYLYCLEQLSKRKGKRIDAELILRENLTDVHIFDTFIEEFRKILMEIHTDNPDAELYLNVSSGTPAMKSALQILSAFREFDYIPIQVSTPEKKSNPHVEEKWNYEPEQMWECNDDNNEPESSNRCRKSGNFNFLMQMKKNMLNELIEKYDYTGANTLAETMPEALSEKAAELLNGAEKRYMLEYKGANNVFKKYGYKLLEIEQSDLAPIAEYFLILNLKVVKGEYADFLRAITPLLADLFEMILDNKCGFNVNDYVDYESFDNNKVRKWNDKKLEKNITAKNALSANYKNGINKSPVYSDHLIKLITALSKDKGVVKLCNELRKLEKKLRNTPAHEIVSITNDTIKSITGITAEDIVLRIRELMKFTKLNINDDFFNSYEKMNKIIQSALFEKM